MFRKPKKKYKVLIAAFQNSETCSEIPYLYHKAGCEVHVFCAKESWLLKNSFWEKWWPLFPATEELFAKRFFEINREVTYDWVINADDKALDIINQKAVSDEDITKFLPLSKPRNKRFLCSKAGLSILCAENNILTPTFKIINNIEQLKNSVEEISFPALIKINKSSGGNGVYFCKNKHETFKVWKQISPDKKENLVLQQYIQGQNIAVEALFHSGRLLAYASAEVLQTTGGEFEPSMVRLYGKFKSLEGIIHKLGENFGIHGFANITFMLDRLSGKYFLIESDLRPQAWLRTARICQVDFSAGILNFLQQSANKPVNLIVPLSTGNMLARNFSRELAYYIRHKNYWGMLKWVFNIQNRWFFVPWYDLRLLAASIKTLLVYFGTQTFLWKKFKHIIVTR